MQYSLSYAMFVAHKEEILANISVPNVEGHVCKLYNCSFRIAVIYSNKFFQIKSQIHVTGIG